MTPPPTEIAADLELLLDWRRPDDGARIIRAGAGSLLVHAAFIGVLISFPWDATMTRNAPALTTDLRKSVHLVAPRPFEPTQKAPNQGKIAKELDVRSLMAAPRSQAPVFRPPRLSSSQPAPQTSAAVPEPPKIETAGAPPVAGPQILPEVPKPTVEKPKLAFETPGASQRTEANPSARLRPPQSSISEAVRAASRPGAGGLVVGDLEDLPPPPSLSQPPAPGRLGSNLELLSDPRGVDFKPYLIQVLTAVRRNWLAIIPESARFGRRGRVVIQFIIAQDGSVPKLVIATPSGADALDRAGVASISASYPFPRLPNDYRGNQIRLQLVFSYNMQPR